MTQLLTDIGEFRLHSLMADWIGQYEDQSIAVGVGDDAAVLNIPGDHHVLITVDASSPMRTTASLDGAYLAKQCVIRNFSDILAMGGSPVAFLLVLRLPRDTSVEYVKSLIKATADEVYRYGAFFVGGDTKEHNEVVVDGVALGVAAQGRIVRKSGAHTGDIVAVTLTHGTKLGARWAHEILEHDPELREQFSEFMIANYKLAHLELPFNEMQAICATGHVSSASDTSDGILACLQHIGRASNVSFLLSEELLENLVHPTVYPIADALSVNPTKFLFSMGHDWECVVTVPKQYFGEVRMAAKNVGGDLLPLGEAVLIGESVQVRRRDGTVSPIQMFTGEKFTQNANIDLVQLWRDLRII